MTCARRPSPRISAGELPGRTDRPWLSPSNTAEHRREDARRPSLGGSRWPSEDVSRQLDLPKKDGTVHNTVLSHWTNSKKLFLINGLGVVFCFHRPLHFHPVPRSPHPGRQPSPHRIMGVNCLLASVTSPASYSLIVSVTTTPGTPAKRCWPLFGWIESSSASRHRPATNGCAMAQIGRAHV